MAHFKGKSKTHTKVYIHTQLKKQIIINVIRIHILNKRHTMLFTIIEDKSKENTWYIYGERENLPVSVTVGEREPVNIYMICVCV